MLGFDRDRRLDLHAEAGSGPRKYTEPSNKCQLIQQSQSVSRPSFQPEHELCTCCGLIAATVALAIPNS